MKRIFTGIVLAAILIYLSSCSNPVLEPPVDIPTVEAPAVIIPAPPPSYAPGTITIASFNLQILGPTKMARPNTLTVLATIATRFDILAMQEVGSNNSSATDASCVTIMNNYVARVNEIYGSQVYAYVRGNQYAIVYRSDKFKVDASGLYSGTKSFTYMPLRADFSTIGGNFDFSLICIHTSPGLAVTEIPALKTAITETSAFYGESDVICLGDFNSDGSYYTEGPGPGLSGFEAYITGIVNACDTTVSASSNTYDRIQMTISLSSDYTNQSGVLVFSDYYNLSACEGTATTAGTEAALSDHYPVWCSFNTHLDTD